jgi:hypothetical protein
MAFISYWRPFEGFLHSFKSLRCLRSLPNQGSPVDVVIFISKPLLLSGV